MNFYTLAKRLEKQEAQLLNSGILHGGVINKIITQEEARSSARAQVDQEFERIARRSVQLMLTYKRIMEEEGAILPGQGIGSRQTFFITIRPDTTKTKFHDFYNLVRNYIERKMFINYKLSFEQKGTCEEDLGKGFHVHIVAETTCRSKGEVLRNTISTFGKCTAANCIQVDVCKNPEETVQKYLIDYESKDNHKIETKEWDARWRTNECLDNIYSQLPIKSRMAAESSSTEVQRRDCTITRPGNPSHHTVNFV